ncbi:MAG: methylmalonyl Co-A mutase-associated GTPase MeaB [Acidimicrobiia bacterium]|nr:methylmalonyl Co-A mutase-associated GTPase MeaB [Acidimicrobiia bacterium]MBT8194400.1 methylmalonyl Co-A mutase-associated GTPase MeaB [Acidimicrobiia bacterium]MBT8246172.1 methylmalonyl Co-A mutase-associated GTPase MeaB [Acidimicrobiia bacterium]NNF89034.1 methylmalonyl Co-A mutase-associated GTPase MeaB [Acidimicrobiia bacterium]NNJ46794.1 methylmalonyl Co-A mutase-associated GTPase MeaB [Acidimicrobiia bacterium]
MSGFEELLASALDGDRRALAKLLTIVERGGEESRRLLATVYPRAGTAHVVGVTGPPGAGKSTLVNQLIGQVRAGDDEVAALLVDPSSPFSGGAILGDRIRMQDRVSDPGVYARSMASRGQLGGVSDAAPKAVVVLDAVGFPYIVLETVGVGQAEVDIVESAHTTLVVLNPGWGDSIQAAKAGLLEIGDVFVVNKADRPGVESTVADLNHMLHDGPERAWTPPVLTTVAQTGEGADALWDAVRDHQQYLTGEAGEAVARRQAEREVRLAMHELLVQRAEQVVDQAAFEASIAEVIARRLDPWTAAAELLRS